MSESEIEDSLKCDVCKDFFYDPITLLCQHTFCSYCITSLKECPMCRLKIHLPQQRNTLMTKLIETLYGSEKLEELNNKFHLTKLEKEIRPQVEKDLRTDFDRMIQDNTKTISKPNSTSNSDKDVKSINLTSGTSNPDQTGIVSDAEKEPSFWDFNLDNLIKWVELAFIAYYIYTFIVGATSYGFSWLKLLLNLFVLVQTCFSMFGSSNDSSNPSGIQYLSIGGTSGALTSVLENLL